MTFRKLNIEEFTNFQRNHPLSNFYQTINYGMLMAEHGYDYDLVGLVDDDNSVLAASLILIKSIAIKCFYGYAPRGFLIDYENEELLQVFTQKLKDYYYDKNVIFIKLNPNIAIGEIEKSTYETIYNSYKNIYYSLVKYDYKKLKDNIYFEAQLPRFNAIINLEAIDIKDFNKNTRNKIKKGIRKGLKFDKYEKEYLNEFYNLVKNKDNSSEFFYKDFYTVYEKEDNIDLFLVSINYFEFLQNSQYKYDTESEKNTILNSKLASYNTDKIINAKMNSDKNLLSYKNDIMEATKGLNIDNEVFIAGALVVKHNNLITIIASGYDSNYKRFVPNYFLYYNLIKYYRTNYKYLDLNGVVGDFKNENPYTGLNRFKLGFNPDIYEYIGEYDLIIEPKSYEILLGKGILSKEFNKTKKVVK